MKQSYNPRLKYFVTKINKLEWLITDGLRGCEMDNGETSSIPLFVDLDGTFIKSDMLFESFILSVKQNPRIIFMCLIWLLRGKSYLKYKLSENADIACDTLPINNEFFSFLKKEKENNREIILATASNEKYAKSICDNYDIFDSYISSSQDVNLKGKEKLKKIETINTTFAYAGNSIEDFDIFDKANETYLVNPTRSARSKAASTSFEEIFDDEKISLKVWIKQLRIHQWLKNILIFVPLLVSESYLNVDLYLATIIGFISFSCLASATYIINDLLDLEADRVHERKKNRPLAAGNISILNGMLGSLVLFIISFSLSSQLNDNFVYGLLAYLVITLVYSLKIKLYVGMDVITLASLYTIRILVGSIILGVTVSFWLFSFSMFIFLSLALIKRCAELKALIKLEAVSVEGRDYNTSDYNVLMSFGTSSSLLAVLMFCFYTNNEILIDQYQEPDYLWLIIPALCYWLIRMWVKTDRGEMHDDPIIYSLRDKGSLVTISFIVIVTVIAQII